MKQMKMNLNKGKRGGRRENSGRKRLHSRGVAHRVREKVSVRTPLHINFKYRTQIRNKDNLRLLKRAILNSRKHGLRIIHFSLQSNHVHLGLREARNAIEYVCFNKQKHEKGTYSVMDDYGSLPAPKWIQAFAKKARITIKVNVLEVWAGDRGRSYFLKKILLDLG